jgi:hypothetical protein
MILLVSALLLNDISLRHRPPHRNPSPRVRLRLHTSLLSVHVPRPVPRGVQYADIPGKARLDNVYCASRAVTGRGGSWIPYSYILRPSVLVFGRLTESLALLVMASVYKAVAGRYCPLHTRQKKCDEAKYVRGLFLLPEGEVIFISCFCVEFWS